MTITEVSRFPGSGAGTEGRDPICRERRSLEMRIRTHQKGMSVSDLRTQKSSTEIPTFFGRPLLGSLSLSLSSSQLPTSTELFRFSPCGVSILLFLAVVTDTHNILSAGKKREGGGRHTNLFLSLSSLLLLLRDSISSHFYLFSLFLSCRAAPLRDHGRRDRGRAGQGAEVPATDDGRVPRPDERDQDEEGRQPPPADARVLQVTTKVSEAPSPSLASISTACSNLASSIEWNPCRRFAL